MAGLTVAQAALADVLIDRTPLYNGVSSPSQEGRQADPYRENSESWAFDNFALGEKTRIDRIEWWGLIASAIPMPETMQFNLMIYGSAHTSLDTGYIYYPDVAYPNGEALWTAQATPTFDAVAGSGRDDERALHFSYDLDTPLTLDAGEAYWLGIVATQANGDALYFRWNVAISDPGDPYPYSFVLMPMRGELLLFDYPCCTDQAMRISGEAVADTGSVPEPASWALMLFGFGAIGAVVRRRQAILRTA